MSHGPINRTSQVNKTNSQDDGVDDVVDDNIELGKISDDDDEADRDASKACCWTYT